ncbi:MAG: hypothetical protein HPY45_00015 [Anaerolineae bacterium]|nr:hypothetical protein [Anaerolineae bacterium]
MMLRNAKILVCYLALFLFLQSCVAKQTTVTVTASIPPSTATPAPTATMTPLPMAVWVNGEGILLSEYQAELQRLEAAQTEMNITQTPEERQKRVLDDLVAQTLLAQAASAGGYQVTEDDIQQRVERLAERMGGAQQLTEWMAQNGYTEESFRLALRRAMAAAWQKEQIMASIPSALEQIHAQQILVFDADLAQQIYNQLQGGADFAALRWLYDPQTGGELGWFPRGYLTRSEIESAVFNLQPGQYTPVVQTDFGYHIVFVVQREAQHPLTADARRVLQQKALEEWIAKRRTESEINILVE